MECMICGGLMMVIGVLGRTRWYRCRNCGIDDRKEVEDDGAETTKPEESVSE